jgi:predicted ester cyclase
LRQLPQPLSTWLAGLSRVSRCLDTVRADCRPAFDAAREEVEQAVQYLEQEEEISARMTAADVLAVVFEHFPSLRGQFAVAVAKADQVMGREALLAQFHG